MKSFYKTLFVCTSSIFAVGISAVFGATISWNPGTGDWETVGAPGWVGAVPTSVDRASLNAGDIVTLQDAFVGVDANPNDVRLDSTSSLTIAAGAELVTAGDDGVRSIYVGNFGQGASMIVNGTVDASSGRLFVGGFGSDERSGTLTVNTGGSIVADGPHVQNNSTIYMEGGTIDSRAGGFTTFTVQTRDENVGFGLADNKGHVQLNSGQILANNFTVAEDSTTTVAGGLLSTDNNLNVGSFDQSQTAVFTQSGGVVDIASNLNISQGGNSASGIYNMQGGILDVAATLDVNNGGSGTGLGTFNFTGGTVKISTISMNQPAAENVFNWSAGTLTKSEFFDSQINISSDGTGSAFVIGDGVGTNDAILDLGDSYLNGGAQQTFLDGNADPSLVLNSDSQLSAVNRMLLHRVGNIGTFTSGSLTLLRQFNGGITGEFGSFTGAGLPNFSGDVSTLTDPSQLPLETVFLAYVDAAGNHKDQASGFDGTVVGVELWYNIQGSAPEPSTVAFLVMGATLLRLSRKRYLFRKTQSGV